MKVLILPAHRNPSDTASFMLARDIEAMMESNGRQTAVCSRLTGFNNAVKFDAPVPSEKKKLFGKWDAPDSQEEVLYRSGMLEAAFLKDDIDAVRKAIRAYQPDMIFEFCRPSGIIAARAENIPFISYVPYGTYKDIPFETSYLKAINKALSDHHLEQILRIRDMYDAAARRITIGPSMLYPKMKNVYQLGSLCSHRKAHTEKKQVCIFLGSSGKWPKELIEESFLGAPYDVFAWYTDAQASARGHLKIMSTPRTELIAGSEACIHDGTDVVFSKCLYLGIPQILIDNGSWNRHRNASALIRLGSGIVLNEETVTMAKLYESYRKIVTEPAYKKRALRTAEALYNDPDLSETAKHF